MDPVKNSATPSGSPTPMSIATVMESMRPELAVRMFDELSEVDRPFYRTVVVSMAQMSRLRPVFLDRKPKPERHLWMHRALLKKSASELAGHVLQMWLVKCHPGLLCRFLDSLGIAHEEDGTVEALPSSPGREALEKAVEDLISHEDPELAKIYLAGFCALNPGLWQELEEIVAARWETGGDLPVPPNEGLQSPPGEANTAEI